MSLMHEPGYGETERPPEMPPAAKPTPGGTARIIGLVAFALVPWLTCGFGSPVAFGVVAVLYSRVSRQFAALLWTSTALYVASDVVAMATTDSAPGTAADHLFGAALAVSLLVAGTEAAELALLIGIRGYHRQLPSRRRTHRG